MAGIGMCWIQHHTATTPTMPLTSSQYYPLRLRYQAGCGGGSIAVSVCDGAGQNCQLLSPLDVSTGPTNEFPITVWPSYVEVASAAEAYYTPKPTEVRWWQSFPGGQRGCRGFHVLR